MRDELRLTAGPLLPTPPNPSWARARRGLIALGLVGVIAAGAVAYHRLLLEAYARLFRVDDPAPCDAIVILLGGPDSRPARAASLYLQGFAPRIVFCRGGFDVPGGIGEARLTQEILTRAGVPLASIRVIDEPVTSTKEEADAILRLAEQEKMTRLTVVTTSFHKARASWIFRRVFRGSGIEVRMAAATDPHFDETNWYRRDESLIVYFIETLKTLVYRVRY